MNACGENGFGKNTAITLAKAIRAFATRINTLREAKVPSTMMADAMLCSARAK
jgi:hypothetical protein